MELGRELETESGMGLVVFDLDNTLLGGDSDHAWGEFLVAKGLVDAKGHASQNDAFYRDYQEGNLDIDAYVRFTLGPVLNRPINELNELHKEFMQTFIAPIILPKAQRLLAQHRAAGDYCLIMSATNSFITKPIAQALEVDDLLATGLEIVDRFYTGNIEGTPCFQEGKVIRLQQWIETREENFSLEQSTFYSDSINDLPLLKAVVTPIAVDPDPALEEYARLNKWKIISLR